MANLWNENIKFFVNIFIYYELSNVTASIAKYTSYLC